MTYDDSLDSLLIGLALCLLAVLVTLTANAYTTVCRALDTRTDRRARHAAHTHHARRITAHDDEVALALNDACCEPWWTSCGTHHEPTCPHHTRSSR